MDYLIMWFTFLQECSCQQYISITNVIKCMKTIYNHVIYTKSTFKKCFLKCIKMMPSISHFPTVSNVRSYIQYNDYWHTSSSIHPHAISRCLTVNVYSKSCDWRLKSCDPNRYIRIMSNHPKITTVQAGISPNLTSCDPSAIYSNAGKNRLTLLYQTAVKVESNTFSIWPPGFASLFLAGQLHSYLVKMFVY